MFWRKGKNLAGGRCQRGDPRGGFFARGFVKEHRTGRWKLPRMIVCMWHLSAPRSAVCARDFGPSAKAEDGDVARRFPVWAFPFLHPPRTPWRNGRKGLPSGRCPSRRTMPTHPPSPAPLCAAQARPARRSELKRKGRSDARSLPPCRRRETIFHEPGAGGSASSPPAPRRPRLAATPCSVSVAGWEDCRHRFGGRGKSCCDFFRRLRRGRRKNSGRLNND